MKKLVLICLCLALFAGATLAGPIDGKWVSERKMERDGQSFTIVQTFDLKEDAGKLTGKLAMQFGDQEGPSAEIQDGKIDGNKFSFSTMLSTPNGDFKVNYIGTVEGDLLKGKSERDGGQSRDFEAKRK